MSVEYSKFPGQTFYRKTLKCVALSCENRETALTGSSSALKLQMQAMLLSTSYNSIRTVLSNLYHAFSEVAAKSYHYIRSLPTSKQPGGELLISKSQLMEGARQSGGSSARHFCRAHHLQAAAYSVPEADPCPAEAVHDTISLACVLMRRRKRTSKDILPYECAVSGSQTRW